MTIPEILLLPHKSEIDRVAGTITAVKAPKEPSANQASHGIHTQDITVSDGSGNEIIAQIMSKDMHLPPKVRGCKILISASDRGTGLSMNVYKENRSLSVSKWASVQIFEADQKLESSQKTSAKREDKMQDKQQAAQPANRMTVEDLTNAFLDIMFGVSPAIASNLRESVASSPLSETAALEISKATMDNARCIATTVFIEANRQGLIRPKQVQAPKADVPQESKAPIANRADPAVVLSKIVQSVREGNLLIDKADDAIERNNLSWEQVYDASSAYLITLYSRETVDCVYDRMKAAMLSSGVGTMDNERFCREICNGFSTFVEEVQSFKTTEIDPDDIPY